MYEKRVNSRGTVQYALDGKAVKTAEVPEEIKTVLEGLDPGIKVDASGNQVATDPTSDPDDVDDESGIDEEVTKPQPKNEEGMGFKRVKGKTVDIFDGKTPHTHVRFVGGIMAPLNEANFKEKSDAEIIARLKELGKL